MKTLYLAYGSNLNLEQMACRCPTAKVVGQSVLQDHELVFRGSNYGAVATVEPKAGQSVPVLLWEIEASDEQALDRYEGWPDFYRKEISEVEQEGQAVQPMIYIMNDGYAYGEPSVHYLQTIEEGYRSAGFDLEFLHEAVEKSLDYAQKELEQAEDQHQLGLQ